MSILDASRNRFGYIWTGLLSFISSCIHRLASIAARGTRSRKTFIDFAYLSDHQLADIGLCRSDLTRDGLLARRVLREAAKGHEIAAAEAFTD